MEFDKGELSEVFTSPAFVALSERLMTERQEIRDGIAETNFEDPKSLSRAIKDQGKVEGIDLIFEFVEVMKSEGKE